MLLLKRYQNIRPEGYVLILSFKKTFINIIQKPLIPVFKGFSMVENMGFEPMTS